MAARHYTMWWLVGADALEQPVSLPLPQLRPNFVGIMAANLAAQKARGCSQVEPEPCRRLCLITDKIHRSASPTTANLAFVAKTGEKSSRRREIHELCSQHMTFEGTLCSLLYARCNESNARKNFLANRDKIVLNTYKFLNVLTHIYTHCRIIT